MRVLVVEDYRPLADLVAEGLSDQGMATDVAYDGTQAKSKLTDNSYDVVVLDRNLPGIHGDALCKMISGDDKRVMVLMLSGAESPDDRVLGLSIGADDYLTKPFHLPELVLRVRALAGHRSWARPPVLRLAGLELDSVCCSVRRNGRLLHLSRKEFAVLEALMAAFPGYLSAENLLDKVWDENADPFTKTVTVTMARLRRRLGLPQVIRTIPRVGYGIAGGGGVGEVVNVVDADGGRVLGAAPVPPVTPGPGAWHLNTTGGKFWAPGGPLVAEPVGNDDVA